MARLEAVLCWYAITVAVLLALFGDAVPGRGYWMAGHLAVVPLALWITHWPLVARVVTAACLVLSAFTSLGSFIADLVPEPMHWRVARWDALVGGPIVKSLLETPPPWLVEVCQTCYSTFYILPLLLGLVLLWQRKRAALEHGAEVITGGFLLSYLGYVLAPTLPPYLFLNYATPLEGGAAFAVLNPLLFDLEAVRQDCMPSGHTMLTLLTCALAWRHARWQLLWLVPISSFLILATVVLRYHWLIDVLVAVPVTVLAWKLFPERTHWHPAVSERLSPRGARARR